jgi:uncharacterized protein (TIGR00730 family)
MTHGTPAIAYDADTHTSSSVVAPLRIAPIESPWQVREEDTSFARDVLADLRDSTELLEPYRDRPKATIFGSARLAEHTTAYQQVRTLAQDLSNAGYVVLTGGGPGIMHAGLDGAGEGSAVGVAIHLPFEAPSRELGVPLVVQRRFLTRKLALVRHVRAIVAAAGGLGTLDELAEVLTLLQTGHKQPTPVVLLDDGSGVWQSFDALFASLAGQNLVCASDRSLYTIVDTPQAAFAHIQRFWSRYRGCDMHAGTTMLKLATPVDPAELAALQVEFAELQPVLHPLGLAVNVQGKLYSRVRELIDVLNAPHLNPDTAPADDGRLSLAPSSSI